MSPQLLTILKQLSAVLSALSLVLAQMQAPSAIKLGGVVNSKLGVADNKIRFESGYRIVTSTEPNGTEHGIARIFTAPVNFKKNGILVALQDGFVDRGSFIDFGDTPFHVQLPKQFNGQHKFITDSGESFFLNPFGGNPSSAALVDKGYKDIDGNTQMVLVYPEAFNGVDVEYDGSWAGIESYFKIKNATSSSIEFDLLPDNQAITTNGITAVDIQENGKIVSKIHKAFAKNKDGKPIDVTTTITTQGSGKHIQYSITASLSDYPVTIDPLQRFCNTAISSPCAQISTVDGKMRVLGTCSDTITSLKAKANATSLDSTTGAALNVIIMDACSGAGSSDALDKGVLQFDTGNGGASAIGSTSLVVHSNGNAQDCAMDFKWAPAFFNSSSTNALITTNWANASNTRMADYQAWGGVAADIYYDWLLYSTSSPTYLSATTTTKIMLQGAADTDSANGSCSNSGSSINYDTSKTTGVSDDPQLIVDYTASAVAVSPPNDEQNWFLLFLLKELKGIFYI